MDPIILNRLGIVLNFVAGFLIAPDLIGIERLKKWEGSIEIRLQNLKSSTEQLIKNSSDSFLFSGITPRNEFEKASASIVWKKAIIPFIYAIFTPSWLSIASILFLYVIIIAPPILFGVSIYTLLPIIAFNSIFAYPSCRRIISDYKDENYRYYDKPVWVQRVRLIKLLLSLFYSIFIGQIFSMFIMIPLVILAALVYLISASALRFIKFFLDLNLKAFDGNDRLQGFMVGVGIVFFIIGNLFQLIATF